MYLKSIDLVDYKGNDFLLSANMGKQKKRPKAPFVVIVYL
jgi:hypothetical protein